MKLDSAFLVPLFKHLCKRFGVLDLECTRIIAMVPSFIHDIADENSISTCPH